MHVLSEVQPAFVPDHALVNAQVLARLKVVAECALAKVNQGPDFVQWVVRRVLPFRHLLRVV